jgi:hypothetical protein
VNFQTLYDQLSTFDIAIFGINLLLLIFSRWIVYGFNKPAADANKEAKLWTLRAVNVVLLIMQLIAIFETKYIRQISLTGLTVLFAFVLVYFFQIFLLHKFGRTKEIEGEIVRYETYQSEIFGLLGIILAFIVSVLVIINIWGITDWLQATSVLGGVLLLIYSTKDVWAPDHINGLMLLYNGDVEPGSVVKVDELGLLGVTLRITLIQAVFRDLRGGHRVLVPNSKLRNSRIDVLTKGPGSGLRQFADFKIGYGHTSESIEKFLQTVWENACEMEAAINNEKPPAIKLQEAGDHAITWRMVYSLKNVYRLISAQCAINRAAYDLSLQENIGLNTPLTHEVSISEKPEAIPHITNK